MMRTSSIVRSIVRPKWTLLAVVWFASLVVTESQRCLICGPQEEGGSCQPYKVMDVPENITINDGMCTAIEGTEYHKDVLCQEFQAPKGYYFECADQTNSQFSCRSTCGPSIDSIGTGPGFDLLDQGGGLLLGKEANKGSLFDFSNFKNGNALDFGLNGIGRNAFGQNNGNTQRSSNTNNNNNNNKNNNNGDSRFQANNVGGGSSSSSSSSSQSDGGQFSSNIFDKNLFGNQGLTNNAFNQNNNNNNENNKLSRNQLNQFVQNNGQQNNLKSPNIFQFKNPFANGEGDQKYSSLFNNPFTGTSSVGAQPNSQNSFRQPPSSTLLNIDRPNRPAPEGPDPFKASPDPFNKNSDPFNADASLKSAERTESTENPTHGKRDTDNNYPDPAGPGRSEYGTNDRRVPAGRLSQKVQNPGKNSGLQINVSPSNLVVTADESEVDLNNKKKADYQGPVHGIAVGEPDPNGPFPGYSGPYPPDVNQNNSPGFNGVAVREPDPSGPFPGNSEPYLPNVNEKNPPQFNGVAVGEPDPSGPFPGNSGPYPPDVNQNNSPGFNGVAVGEPDPNGKFPVDSKPYLPDVNQKDPPRGGPFAPKNYDFNPSDTSNQNVGAPFSNPNSFPNPNERGGAPPPSRDSYPAYDPRTGNPTPSIPSGKPPPNPQNIGNQNAQNPSYSGSQYENDDRTRLQDGLERTSGPDPFNANRDSRRPEIGTSSGQGQSGLEEKGVKAPAGLDGSRLKEKYQPDKSVDFDGTSLMTDSDYLDRRDKDNPRSKVPKEFEKPFQAESNIFPGFNDFANGNGASSIFGTGESVFNLFKDKDSSPPGFQNGQFNFNNKDFLRPDDYHKTDGTPGSKNTGSDQEPSSNNGKPRSPPSPSFPLNQDSQSFFPRPPSGSPVGDKENSRFAQGPQVPVSYPSPNKQGYTPNNPAPQAVDPYNNPRIPADRGAGPARPNFGQPPLGGLNYQPGPQYEPRPGQNPNSGYGATGPSPPTYNPPRDSYHQFPGNRPPNDYPMPAASGPGRPQYGYQPPRIDPTSGQPRAYGDPNAFQPPPGRYNAQRPGPQFIPNRPPPPAQSNPYQYPSDNSNNYNSLPRTYPPNPQNNVHNPSAGPFNPFSGNYPQGNIPNAPKAPILHPNGQNINGPPPRRLGPNFPGYGDGATGYPSTPGRIGGGRDPTHLGRQQGLPRVIPAGSYPAESNNYRGPPQAPQSYPPNAFSPRPRAPSSRDENLYQYGPISNTNRPSNGYPGAPPSMLLDVKPLNSRETDQRYPDPSQNPYSAQGPAPPTGRGFDPYSPPTADNAPTGPQRQPTNSGPPSDAKSFTPEALLDASPFSFDDPVGSFGRQSQRPNQRDAKGSVGQTFDPRRGSVAPVGNPFFASVANQEPQTSSHDQMVFTPQSNPDYFNRRKPGDFGFDGNFGSFGEGQFNEGFSSNRFNDPDGYFGDSAFTNDTTTEEKEETSSNKESQDLT